MADNAGLEIIVPKALPSLICNRVQITEVLRNLITNSMKYNSNKNQVVEISAKNTTRSGRKFMLISVKDNGIGIDKKFHKSVFEMFKRLHKENVYGGGTGAGLGFVKRIVQRHGGEVWLDSKNGEGTTFYIALPKIK